MPFTSVAIVGAGLAGLACARTLAAHGVAARLFDKGRAPGGRLATRRIELDGRSFGFDHGAQYLTARGAVFASALDAAGAKPWIDETRRVGVPRMSAIPRALADGLDLATARHVAEIAGEPGAWRLRHLDAALVRPGRPVPPDAAVAEDGPFDAVVLAVPAPQAVPLLAGPATRLAEVIGAVRLAPCWTLMAAFPDRLPLPDTLRLTGGPIGWAARDSSKPGRDASAECWVVQAGPEWTREHLERPAAEVAALLLDALGKLAGGAVPAPLCAAAHRWRHALVETPLGAPCLWDPALRIGACGDWCIAPRAEAAADSGAALAAAMHAAP
ncbi:NAD(P)/FAD-dependent oxidoreductase [Falsiroseomonas sp. CW058]|uniref:NAD(P)/FAD-dependent oxidoreductase n=1 Tax=Falsiroseomonas sp. CW058 TaxID=3388664 RepID=UPI003D31B182